MNWCRDDVDIEFRWAAYAAGVNADTQGTNLHYPTPGNPLP